MGRGKGEKKIGSILWYENFYNFFSKELEILVQIYTRKKHSKNFPNFWV
jgi:hypothetical protein